MKLQIRAFFAALLMLMIATVLVACRDGEGDETDLTAPALPTGDLAHFLYEQTDGGITILGYSGLEREITIPDTIEGLPVVTIAPYAFRDFSHLERVVIPDSVTVIDYAFMECRDLTYVFIGKNVLSMNGAFTDCQALLTVVGGDHAVYMNETFAGCRSLTVGKIPASVKSATAAYEGCSSLRSVTIAEGLTVLDRTFADCSNLRTVTVPAGVTEAIAAFDGCTALTEVTGGNDIAVYTDTFRNCVQLTELTLGPAVSCLEGAFVGCTSLIAIHNLPTTVQYYKASFTDCRSLRTLTIPTIADEKDRQSYTISADISKCESLETLTVLADIPMQTDFCQSFAGCLSLTDITLTDDTFSQFLRVSYSFTDTVYDGDDTTITKTVSKYRTAAAVRVTDQYGTVNGVSYTHIYGGDLEVFDPDALLAGTAVLGFSAFQKTTYWCGYPDGGNRTSETVGIARTYSYFLRATGKNDGTLPKTVTINEIACVVGE